MLTGPGQITDIGFRKRFFVGQLVNLHPGDAFQLVTFILFEGNIVFGHAGHHARTASGAQIQIDNHSKFFG
jgi:hypothetical protein